MSNNISDGASYLLRGMRLLRHPRLRPFVTVPLLLNTIIFALLLYWVIGLVNATIGEWIALAPDWLAWLIWPLVILALTLLTGYLFTAVAILIASPFNGLLAEKAEELITGEAVAGHESITAAAASLPRALLRELSKYAYYLPLALGTFVLSLVPLINTLSPLLWLVFGAWMMALQYVDYPMDNHGLSFREVRERLRQRRLAGLGFGGLVALFSGVPLLNFFVIPAAVCGAVVFWCEELKDRNGNAGGNATGNAMGNAVGNAVGNAGNELKTDALENRRRD